MARPAKSPMASTDVRDHNLGLVLKSLDKLGRAARAEIALETGLARSAMSNLSAVLLANRLIRVAEGQARPRVGHPLERLELDGRHLAFIAAQVEVDETLVTAQDLAGRTIYREVLNRKTPRGNAGAVADMVSDSIKKCMTAVEGLDGSVLNLDLIVPGMVMRGSGVVSYALDLGWIDVPFLDLVSERVPGNLASDVHLSGDAQFAAYGEYSALRADEGLGGLTDMLYVKSATGIGGAVIMNGEILRGSQGAIFAPGHVIVDPHGALCECGRRGCLVTVADPEIVLRNAGLQSLRQDKGLPNALDELVKRALSGDRQAFNAVDEALEWIRIVVDNAIHMYEPQIVVLGGYLAAFPERIAQLADLTIERLGYGEIQRKKAILPSRLGPFAAIQGALEQRRQKAMETPARYGILGQDKAV
jgi:predicted NBD/HSP70 family sugar kinase